MSAPVLPMFSSDAAAVAQRLGLNMGRPNLEVFADTLLALARDNRNVLAVTSDSRGSGKLGPLGNALPEQLVEVGIAEQNLVGVSAAWPLRVKRSSQFRRPVSCPVVLWSRLRMMFATPIIL